MPFPSPGELPNPGIERRSPSLQADALTSEPIKNVSLFMHMYNVLCKSCIYIYVHMYIIHTCEINMSQKMRAKM